MDIMISCTENYVFPACVLCKSLVENNQNVCIHVFENELSDKSKNMILDAVGTTGTIRFYKVDTSVFDDIVIPRIWNGHITIEAYFRLLILKYLDKDIGRVLYLDTDTVCNADISAVYNMDMGDRVIAACNERGFNLEKEMKRKVYDNLGFKLGDNYFNSGVILFDLSKIRLLFDEDYLVDWGRNNQEIVIFHDQDILNYCFKNMVAWLPAYMNLRPFHYYFTSKTKNEILKKGKIIHFGEKPWINPQAWCSELFWKYAELLNDWGEYSKPTGNKNTYIGILKHNIKILLFQRERNIDTP